MAVVPFLRRMTTFVPLPVLMLPMPPTEAVVPEGSTNVVSCASTLTTSNRSPLMESTSPDLISTSHVPSSHAWRFVPSAATSGTGTVVAVVVVVVVVGAVVVVGVVVPGDVVTG